MAAFFFRGMLIGLLFGVPAGAVGAMTVQRTWNYGTKAGLLTGMGSSVADCIYACIGAFGLTVISEFLLKYQNVINLAGGGLILYMGLHLIFGKKEADANVVEDVFEAERDEVSGQAEKISSWIEKLELKK